MSDAYPGRRKCSRASLVVVWLLTLGFIGIGNPASAEPGAGPEPNVQRFAAGYLAARNAQLVTDPTGSQSAARVAENTSAGFLNAPLAHRVSAQLAQLRERRAQLSAIGEQYTQARTSARVLRSRRIGAEVVARVEEKTEFVYAKIHGDEPGFTAFRTQRDFVFRRSSNGWRITDVRLMTDVGPLPVNEVSGTVAALAGAPRGDVPSSSSIDRPRATQPTGQSKAAIGALSMAASYNYTAMADYARRYVFAYNTAYRRQKNDCTNFISQAMRAGGWSMVSGWYRSNGVWWYNWLNQSYTWAAAENYYWFATGSGRTYILGSVWFHGAGRRAAA